MDVFATKKVTRKSCDKTHKGKFLKKASPSTTKNPKHPTKPKTTPRNCDRYAFDFTRKDDWAGWDLNDDDWDFDDDYSEQSYKDEDEWNGWFCLILRGNIL